MIIIKVSGGLGNQMFQYAIAKILEKHSCGVNGIKLDITGYKKDKLRKFELANVFDIDLKCASRREIKSILRCSKVLKKIEIKLFKKNIFFEYSNYLKVDSFKYSKKIYELNKDIYMDGYWQNYQYFLKEEDFIKGLFRFKRLELDTNKKLLNEIKNTNSVSLHIRRGDYVEDEKSNIIHGGICGKEYYRKAIRIIESKISNPHFYIFSDDMAFSKRTFSFLKNKTFVCGNSKDRSYIDMQLMKGCKHNIIANSTFSWWAAFLNNYKQKIIVAPRKWINTKEEINLIPDEWFKI